MVAVPLKILQDSYITFSPGLPVEKQDAIDDATIWEVFKAFFEFFQKFYSGENVIPVSPSTDVEDWFYVHIAPQSARTAVAEIGS